MPIVKRHIIIFIKRNIKKSGFKYIMKLLIDFHKDKSSREVLEVLSLKKRFISIAEIIFLNTVPSAFKFIIITAYISHIINKYIRLIIIAIVIIYI